MLNLRGKHGLGLFLVLISGELGFYSPRALDRYRFRPILMPIIDRGTYGEWRTSNTSHGTKGAEVRKQSEKSPSDPPELFQVFRRRFGGVDLGPYWIGPTLSDCSGRTVGRSRLGPCFS